MQHTTISASVLAATLAFSRVFGEEPEPLPARVNNLKVLSDKIDDVTTVENVLRSFCRPGMTDQERAAVLWAAAVKYRHQASPPEEYLAADWEAHDPIKIFNVYGYCMCCCSSALIEALNRLDGREARGRILTGHSVPEVRYGDAWHMYDASLLTHFPKPGGELAASVDEIAEAVTAWHANNPGYRGDASKLLELMRSEDWTGWKSKGPELLAHCPFYDLGYLPARTHGWDATMIEYDRKPEIYEYGYHIGHRALLSLRPGETITREAGNRGLHVNMDQTRTWDLLAAKAPGADLVYLGRFFPGYRGAVVGNGTHRYAPDLASGGLAVGADLCENLASGGSPALHINEAGRPGVAIVQISSPYVYLGGRLRLSVVRRSDTDQINVSISTNNGRNFSLVWTTDRSPMGLSDAVVDLSDKILRRYTYWLKIEITSDTAPGAGLEAFEVENDIQHSPRTLPRLGTGDNTITVAADSDVALATRSIACRITPDREFRKNETTCSMGITFENLDVQDGSCWWKGGQGTMTVPIDASGDLETLRWSVQVRARGREDLVKMLVSSDEGSTWREAGRIAGPTPGKTAVFQYADWPQSTRKALLQFELTGNSTIGIFSFRLDADYHDPLAAKVLRPFHVVHRWTEQGREKKHDELITRLPFAYTIEAATDPEMVSVTYDMPTR